MTYETAVVMFFFETDFIIRKYLLFNFFDIKKSMRREQKNCGGPAIQNIKFVV